GGRNGLVLHGRANYPVSLSVDGGKCWQACGPLRDGMDLTDRVKGRRQYLLRLDAGAKALAGSPFETRTVCQANASVMPHLKEGGDRIEFAASGEALLSAGPTRDLCAARIVAGAFGTPSVTLELAMPRGEPVAKVYAAAHVFSGNPPSPEVNYFIDYSTDGGR